MNRAYGVYAGALSGTVFLGGAAEALSVGAAVDVGVSLTVAIPYILVALGIGSLGYVVYKSNVINEIAQYVEENYDVFQKENAETGDKEGEKIVKFHYEPNNKQFFCPKDLIELIARKALDMGLFDDYVNVGYDYSTFNGQNFIIADSSNVNVYDFLNVIKSELSNNPEANKLWNKNYEQILDTLSPRFELYNLWLFSTNKTGDGSFLFYFYGLFVNYPITLIYKDKFSDNQYRYALQNYNGEEFYLRLAGYYGNNDYLSPLEIRTQSVRNGFYNFYYSWYDGRLITISDVLIDILQESGIPNTGNIPSISNNIINMPTWITDIDNVLGYPVSLPDNYTIPVVIDFGVPFPSPFPVDVPGYTFPVPVPGVEQPGAQRGTGSPPTSEPVLLPYPVEPSLPDIDFQIDDFLLPGTISNKFPFSIPGDIVLCARSALGDNADFDLDSIGAPVYSWNYNIAGVVGRVDIDLSDFSSLAYILRRGIFLLFMIGLLSRTYDMFRE